MTALPRPVPISVSELAERLDDPRLCIFDTTAVLDYRGAGDIRFTDGGPTGYAAGHIPGAAYVDLGRQLSDTTSPFNFTVPSAERFAAAAGALGIGAGVEVVAYSRGHLMFATRLWWLLRYFGFDDVRVLDGGLDAWVEAGLPVSTQPVVHPPAAFVGRPRPELLATRADVERVVHEGGACLVNALNPEVYRGETNPYGRPGRIPGSISSPYQHLLQPGTWRLRPEPEIRDALARSGVLTATEPVIVYSGGGMSATIDLYGLALVGGPEGRLYDGSMTEWVADPDLPVVLG